MKNLNWKPLPSDPHLRHNHLAWDVNGIKVIVSQPGVAPCPRPEKCDPDTWWITHVEGIKLHDAVDDTLLRDTPYLARQAAEPAIRAILSAKPVDLNFKSDQAIANALGKIIRGGYNAYEAYLWSKANDANGSFEAMLLDPALTREHIDGAYKEIVKGGDVDRDEAEGRAPGTRTRDALLSKISRNPSLKRKLMR